MTGNDLLKATHQPFGFERHWPEDPHAYFGRTCLPDYDANMQMRFPIRTSTHNDHYQRF